MIGTKKKESRAQKKTEKKKWIKYVWINGPSKFFNLKIIIIKWEVHVPA